MVMTMFGLTHAASTKAAVQSYRKQSIPCSGGIKRPTYATPIYLMSVLQKT
jgi:hypothetical protein